MNEKEMIERLDVLETEAMGGMDPEDYAANLQERVAIQSALGWWGD